ncbi:Adenylyltransferase and sulfurtransferase MOCS3 [Paramicrosporidium saccamoebae]|uniref:Adenylyltransferase and sulfurtransferase MOCS3 n=1 Tax=Paramicrosporidium saccamoebae TaxID=1246581 RepID=A0A2H9TF99_9FUNG|nr:Adenylyltransferase and sulfurtransferase MOCS3 [Paramicrosporidium saccamoebae]
MSLCKEEIERYCRQLILPGFGIQGQERIRKASVLIVGAGGLGCPVGLYLAAAGIGRLGIVDYDTVEVSNLHRQVAHAEKRTGMTKVDSLADTLSSLNSGICIERHNLLISSGNALDLIASYQIIVDATDNVTTRYLLNDACVLLKKVLVSGAALRWDGQLTTLNYGIDGPCYRCLHPEPPASALLQSCDMNGVAGPVPGIIGCMQALEVLRLVALEKPNYSKRMVLFSGETGAMRVVSLRSRRPGCAICGENPTITQLIDYVQFCGASADDKGATLDLLTPEERIDVVEMDRLLEEKVPIHILDVRSREYTAVYPFQSTAACSSQATTVTAIPIDELEQKCSEIPLDCGPVICICRRGNDSQLAVQILKRHHITSRDLIGGIHEYSRTIDPTVPIF